MRACSHMGARGHRSGCSQQPLPHCRAPVTLLYNTNCFLSMHYPTMRHAGCRCWSSVAATALRACALRPPMAPATRCACCRGTRAQGRCTAACARALQCAAPFACCAGTGLRAALCSEACVLCALVSCTEALLLLL